VSNRAGRLVYVITVVAAITGLLFGYDTGVIAGAILFVRKTFHLGSVGTEVVTSAVVLGAIVGAALGGRLSTRLGRRGSIMLMAAVFCLGSVATSVARSAGAVLVGRLVVGVTIGVMSFVGPMYISEVAPADKRGAMVSTNQLAVAVGIVVSYLVDYALAPQGAWRAMFGLAIIPGLLLLVGMWRMPSSPRWLLMNGRRDQARAELSMIRGTDDVGAEMADMTEELQSQQGAGLRDLLAPNVRRGLIVGVGLALLQQITGVNTVIYYAPIIFEIAGIGSDSSSILATVGLGCVNALFTLLAIFLVDRLGRRPLLLISIAGMVLGLLILAVSLRGAAATGVAGSRGPGPVIGLVAYIASFAVGLGPIFWLLISEIYPLRVRGVAMSLATIANWGANFVVSGTFLSLVKALRPGGTFALFAAVGIGAWLFCYFLVPETKNRSLEEIERELRKKAEDRPTRRGQRQASPTQHARAR
jgi:sugar porter (SP) family MFS transporter